MMQRWLMALLLVALAADAGFAGARRPKAERLVPEDPFALAGPDVADPAPEVRLLELEGGLLRLSERRNVRLDGAPGRPQTVRKGEGKVHRGSGARRREAENSCL